jgi:riboflavin kinase/FMN adenylyltransferase
VNPALQFDGLENARLPAQPVHLAIGMFDGVHLGHQSVVETAVHSARRRGGLAGVLTFWPHPGTVLRPENPTRLLLPVELKRRLLWGLGIDFLVEQHFTVEFARTTAAEFVARLKRCLPGLEAVYVGENWRFGRGRTGDVSVLIEEARAAGFGVYSAPRLNHNGASINSSRVRELVAAGEVEAANALLGYSYFSEGVVEPGRKLGRTIGVPTLNLRWEPELLPRFGVYAVTVSAPDGRRLPGVANYGLRPTLEQTARPLLEVHVMAETRLTYGDKVTVQWLRFLRPERKFSGVEELRTQIEADRENALVLLRDLAPQEPPRR